MRSTLISSKKNSLMLYCYFLICILILGGLDGMSLQTYNDTFPARFRFIPTFVFRSIYGFFETLPHWLDLISEKEFPFWKQPYKKTLLLSWCVYLTIYLFPVYMVLTNIFKRMLIPVVCGLLLVFFVLIHFGENPFWLNSILQNYDYSAIGILFLISFYLVNFMRYPSAKELAVNVMILGFVTYHYENMGFIFGFTASFFRLLIPGKISLASFRFFIIESTVYALSYLMFFYGYINFFVMTEGSIRWGWFTSMEELGAHYHRSNVMYTHIITNFIESATTKAFLAGTGFFIFSMVIPSIRKNIDYFKNPLFKKYMLCCLLIPMTFAACIYIGYFSSGLASEIDRQTMPLMVFLVFSGFFSPLFLFLVFSGFYLAFRKLWSLVRIHESGTFPEKTQL